MTGFALHSTRSSSILLLLSVFLSRKLFMSQIDHRISLRTKMWKNAHTYFWSWFFYHFKIVSLCKNVKFCFFSLLCYYSDICSSHFANVISKFLVTSQCIYICFRFNMKLPLEFTYLFTAFNLRAKICNHLKLIMKLIIARHKNGHTNSMICWIQC